ncbi:GNAT family N-acetyltransferase [Herbiconiux daphne]|uniref:GNAT family N-acetyltransferase n=1 Tax=Herbiconiux daphne TaxID=2970914 RepID=A0ABT2H574_9MICO|nr:GNAT family N-acetyltransferase [Herbiconiux daphne]MCS5735089.1 GNAT family N-acetyltransferase [Herbiconiux daphne]
MNATHVIYRLGSDDAEDRQQMNAITNMVNDVFSIEDEGMWRPGHTRTSVDRIVQMAKSGELVVAELDGELVGVIRVQRIDDRTAYSSMLVTHPDHRGQGLARQLRQYVFDYLRRLGITTLRIDNIAPRYIDRKATEFMTDWNERAGYVVVGRVPVEEVHPEVAPMLLVPCDFIQYERVL